tara:strand:+ start:272 stop:478 length:207 start_codon:yes stop_codon:yes gene_type:complete
MGGGLEKRLALPENHQNRVKDLETLTTESFDISWGARDQSHFTDVHNKRLGATSVYHYGFTSFNTDET